jgi:hypothetical protein
VIARAAALAIEAYAANVFMAELQEGIAAVREGRET